MLGEGSQKKASKKEAQKQQNVELDAFNKIKTFPSPLPLSFGEPTMRGSWTFPFPLSFPFFL